MPDPVFNVWIAHRSSGDGDGSQGDPWNGSTQALFDEHMSNLPTLFPNARLCVHLGPCPRDGSGNVTPFQTKQIRVNSIYYKANQGQLYLLCISGVVPFSVALPLGAGCQRPLPCVTCKGIRPV
jgi:hypothetical protein